jgi:hypothetical protein
MSRLAYIRAGETARRFRTWDDEIMTVMRINGASLRIIAMELGRTRSSIQKRLRSISRLTDDPAGRAEQSCSHV